MWHWTKMGKDVYKWSCILIKHSSISSIRTTIAKIVFNKTILLPFRCLLFPLLTSVLKSKKEKIGVRKGGSFSVSLLEKKVFCTSSHSMILKYTWHNNESECGEFLIKPFKSKIVYKTILNCQWKYWEMF